MNRLSLVALALSPLWILGCAREAPAPVPARPSVERGPAVVPAVVAPAPSAAAAPVDVGARVDARFGGARGCLTVQDLDSGEVFERGGDECAVRSLPASTFKVPNALIGLDLGVLKDDTTTYRWDGKTRWNPVWNRDHDLASAVRNSVVWYFQKEAEVVGAPRYRTYLTAFQYGNADVSGPVREFWLNGTLLISPREQLRFFRDLYTGKLPAKARSIEIVRRMLEYRGKAVDDLRERFPFVDAIPADVVFSGKTGSAADERDGAPPDVVGWFVGAFEGRGHRLVFACRLRSEDREKMGSAAARIAYDHLHEDLHFL